MRIVVIAALAVAAVGCNSDESASTASTSADEVPKGGYPHAIEVQLGEQAPDVTDYNCRVTSHGSSRSTIAYNAGGGIARDPDCLRDCRRPERQIPIDACERQTVIAVT